MKAEPIHDAMEQVDRGAGRPRYVLLTPHRPEVRSGAGGEVLPTAHLALVCGRYEGVDERLLRLVDEEVSYRRLRLSGGRRRPSWSSMQSPASFPGSSEMRLLPWMRAFRKVFSNTLSTHGLASSWEWRYRRCCFRETMKRYADGGGKQSLKRTILRRPDLMEQFQPAKEDALLIRELMEELE